jgi:hypothetical protein
MSYIAPILTYTPSPTLERYHASNAAVKMVIGPVGGGKSVGCMLEIFTRALEMPKCIDGIRRSRWFVIRNTYPELKMTTIKTWSAWFPESRCGRIGKIPPISQRIIFGEYDIEVCFIALNSGDDIKKLLSNEFTGGYINEASEVDVLVLDYAVSRIGRYPSKALLEDSESYYAFIGLDSNAPPEDHWIVNRFFTDKEKYTDYELFMQPSPLIYNEFGTLVENPLAENIKNLDGGYEYYWRIYRNSSTDVFNVTVMCKFATTFDGIAVFTEYNDKIHRANYEIMPDKSYPLYLFWDFGRTPCFLIIQYIKGQILVLDEVLVNQKGDKQKDKSNIGLEEFISVLAMPAIMSEKYADMKIVSIGDPAGVRRNDTDNNYCFKILNDHGFNAKRAKTNALTPRIETVKKALTSSVSGQPVVLLSNTLQILHDAFMGGYYYKTMRNSAGQKVATREPDKSDSNPYHHPMDCFEYGALEFLYLPKKVIEKKPLFVNGAWINV